MVLPEREISEYLMRNQFTKNKFSTVIPSTVSLYNTGEAKFKSIKIINEKNQIVNTLKFREKFRVSLTLEVLKDVENVNLTLGIVSKFGEVVLYTVSKNDKYEQSSFSKGIQTINIDINDTLMPSDYSFSFGINLFHTGSCIDYIESFYPFKVEKETIKGDFEYPWETVHGYAELKSNWSIEKKY